ncbi:MAG: glycoside hydrolase family 15 [Actinomycetales bacterium]|nr:glycoside hydrolase family 15 [Actinomycetales bacterium]
MRIRAAMLGGLLGLALALVGAVPSASAPMPGPPRYADLAARAMRDLDSLVLVDGSAVAGSIDGWDYVWPRDASFVAVALTRIGRPDDAARVLRRLAAFHMTSPDGVFEARYDPATGQAPDNRSRQLDGCGWVLWAVGEWYEVTRDDAALDPLLPMVTGCLDAVDASVDPATGLPGPWSDYWEVRESQPTLGTVAALRLGVREAAAVLPGAVADRAQRLGRRLDRGLRAFAPEYARYPGGAARDTAVTFLMPPFAPPDPEVRASWTEAADGMHRPAGGLAPGEGWRRDGVSWTPTTALFALTAAASGDRDTAEAWLDWLDAHRTPEGSLPEKVLADGTPADAAPLAWTCALVLLTLVELDSAG